MKVMNATDAKNRFGELLDSAQAAPVAIQKNGRDVAYVISKEEFENLQSDGVERWYVNFDPLHYRIFSVKFSPDE